MLVMKCCKRPATVNQDHRKGFGPDEPMITSRMCLNCGKHWYGEVGKEREYSKREWDVWINSAFDDSLPQAFPERT